MHSNFFLYIITTQFFEVKYNLDLLLCSSILTLDYLHVINISYLYYLKPLIII